MSVDCWAFNSDQADESILRRGFSTEQADIIREFLNDPKLRVTPSKPSGDATEHHRAILPEQP